MAFQEFAFSVGLSMLLSEHFKSHIFFQALIIRFLQTIDFTEVFFFEKFPAFVSVIHYGLRQLFREPQLLKIFQSGRVWIKPEQFTDLGFRSIRLILQSQKFFNFNLIV